LLDFFIGRQVSPSGTLFDELPLLFSDIVIICTAPFNLADELRNLFLVVRRPSQHAIEHLFDLISCHN